MRDFKEVAKYLKKKIDFTPKAGIVLGSGLGKMADKIDVKVSISYDTIPGFKAATVEGHAGNLLFGYLSDIPVVAMQGRNHFYEGHSMQEITFPIRVLKYLGIEYLITSNAVGAMNENYEIGDIVIIEDHINLMGTNPLIGPNDNSVGIRFPDMSQVYDNEMGNLARTYATDNNIRIHDGIYVALSGPTFETPAEYKFLKIIGADIVGMSTVPEVLVAKHMGLPVYSMSIVTDLGIEGRIVKITHEEVQAAADAAADDMIDIVKHIIVNK